MVNCPVVTTLATPEPLIVPIRPDDTTDTLARPPLVWPTVPSAKLVEQVDHARLLEEGAEQMNGKMWDEGHIGRRAVDALGAEGELAHHLIEAAAAVGEVARRILPNRA